MKRVGTRGRGLKVYIEKRIGPREYRDKWTGVECGPSKQEI